MKMKKKKKWRDLGNIEWDILLVTMETLHLLAFCGVTTVDILNLCASSFHCCYLNEKN